MSSGILEHDTLAYCGKVPWHQLGTFVGNERFTAKEAIEKSGLDWKVELWPLIAQGPVETKPHPDIDNVDEVGNYEVETDSFGVIRTDKNLPLGIVGNRYTPIQNREVFSFFDYLVDSEEGIYETCGSLFNGKKVWVLAKLKDDMIIQNGGEEDITKKYILLCNSHDGKSSLIAHFTPIRVVCNNTLNASFSNSVNRISIRHTSGASEKLKEAHKLMNFTTKYYEEFGKMCSFLAGKEIKKEGLNTYLNKVFPDKKKEESIESSGDRMAVARGREEHYRSITRNLFDQEEARFGANWYSAYNAVTGAVDHGYVGNTLKPERRLDSNWFGKGADMKAEAFKLALTGAS
jgi:phage/plasmid-like protein (TIGR03299 family)